MLDFSNPETVNWYKDKISGLLKLGVGAIKVDFGEAAPYNGLYASGRTGFYEHNPENRKYTGWIRYGGYNHSIGMATHDVMGTFDGPEEVLKLGFVFACDINFPFPDEKMGIRLEDVVVITETGCENLSKGVPRTIEEVVAMIKEIGIGEEK